MLRAQSLGTSPITVLTSCERRQGHRAKQLRKVATFKASSMPDQVVICGGGIIGVATAYYLTLQGVRPLLVETSGIACAASGTLPF